MHDPAQHADADKPQDSGPDEKQDGGEKAALHQLTEAGDKEAGQRRDDVSRGALACSHTATKRRSRPVVDPAKVLQPPRKRSKIEVVERPGTSGRIRTSAPTVERTSRSPGSSESGV